MYFDRFDIVDAWYVWLSSHHDGKDYRRSDSRWWSSYSRFSTMEKRLGYRPAPSLSYDTLNENALEIYRNICRRAGWCDCLKENDERDA